MAFLIYSLVKIYLVLSHNVNRHFIHFFNWCHRPYFIGYFRQCNNQEDHVIK